MRTPAGAVLVDDIEMALHPAVGIFRPQPVQIQFGLEFRRTSFDERLHNRFEREVDSGDGCGHAERDDGFEDAFSPGPRDDRRALIVGLGDPGRVEQILPGKSRFDFQVGSAQDEATLVLPPGRHRDECTPKDHAQNRNFHSHKMKPYLNGSSFTTWHVPQAAV